VTADKRGEESIQSIPTTIQAISGEALEKRGAVEFADYAGQVAGLSYDDLGPGDKKYVIRGVTSTGPATVGVYYDEAVITGSNANDGGGREPDIRLFDLERIEVLKGPQGTLYGASSMSGTIRYITKKPVINAVQGYVQAEGSSTQSGGTNYSYNGAVNLPIVTDAIALRAVAWDVHNSGFIDDDRIPGGPIKDANFETTRGGRVTLRWQLNDDLNILLTGTTQTLETGGSARFTPPGTQSFGDAAHGYPPVPGGDLVNTDLTLSPWKENMQIFGATATYTGVGGVFTATSNYFKRHIDFWFDSSPILFFFGVPIPGITEEPQDRRISSSELRYASKFAGPVNFVVGGLFQDEHNDLTVNVIKSNAFGLPNGPFSPLNSDDALTNPNGNTFFGRADDRVIKQYAAFGEVTWAVTDRFNVLGGVRYFTSKQDGAQVTLHPFGGFGPGIPIGVQSNSASGNKTTFKLNGSYKFDFGLLYLTASEGFRVGGTNPANLPFASGIPLGYRPDTLRNYEIGWKSDLFDRRLRLNAAAYAIRWSDIQIASTDKTGAFTFTTNAGTASVDGFELEAQMLITTGLELDLAGSYENARLTEDQPNPQGLPFNKLINTNYAFNGDKLAEVPPVTLNAALTYSFPVSATATVSLRSDVTYRDASNTQANTQSQFNVRLASYTLVNLRAGVDWNEWNLTAFAKNLFDKRAQVDAISSQQDPLALITLRPRTVGLQVTRKF